MLLVALRSGSILSLFMYLVLRVLFYEFPMDWKEEILLFIKIFGSSCFLFALATAGSARLYREYVKMRKD